MILPDLNLLLYAYNPYTPQHDAARAWWSDALRGEEVIGLPHEITLGFVRIATNPRLGAATVPLDRARATVLGWLAAPPCRVLLPGNDHTEKTLALLAAAQGSGALTSDASLAAYAIAHRATLYTNDTDFARFANLSWKNPLT